MRTWMSSWVRLNSQWECEVFMSAIELAVRAWSLHECDWVRTGDVIFFICVARSNGLFWACELSSTTKMLVRWLMRVMRRQVNISTLRRVSFAGSSRRLLWPYDWEWRDMMMERDCCVCSDSVSESEDIRRYIETVVSLYRWCVRHQERFTILRTLRCESVRVWE